MQSVFVFGDTKSPAVRRTYWRRALAIWEKAGNIHLLKYYWSKAVFVCIWVWPVGL